MKPTIAIFVAGALLAQPTLSAQDDCSDVPDPQKVDCGEVGTKQPDCEAKGCCWQPVASNRTGHGKQFLRSPALGDTPWCFYKPGSQPSCPLNYTSTGAPFSDSEVATMRGFFLDNININGSGAVVASPDTNTPGGSYYYHWERDGALSMQALLRTADKVSDVQEQMDAYVGWVKKVQQEDDPHGQSVLAEPKYMIPGGEVFAGAWCRPQNDGPGLRSHTLIDYADALKAEAAAGGSTTTTTAEDLWPLIQIDLDWQAANWQANGCDLWEEIQSDDFFWNRYTQRAALTKGAAFAKEQGDQTRSDTYAAAAKAVEATLAAHYDGTFVSETQARQKDAAVICAFNDGYLGDDTFKPSGPEVAGTVKTLNELFCDSFAINQADTKAGVPGILYGRYEGDNYAGGNPWILLTSALAEVLYNGAAEIVASDGASMTDEARGLWADVLGWSDLTEQDSFGFAEAVAGAGDGVLQRLRTHVESNGFHLTEQIDSNTGDCMAAKDLTWSYATTLKAMDARSKYYDAVEAARN